MTDQQGRCPGPVNSFPLIRAATSGESGKTWGTMALKLDMIGITAQDLADSLRFYAMLGVPVPTLAEGEDHVECVLPNGLRLAWDTVALMKQINPAWDQPTGHRMGLAFLCDSPAEVDSQYAAIVAAGYTGASAPWDAFWGQRYAQVADPDGNLVDLFAPLSGAAEPTS